MIAGTKVLWGETDRGAIQMFKVLAPLPQMHTYVNLLLLLKEKASSIHFCYLTISPLSFFALLSILAGRTLQVI